MSRDMNTVLNYVNIEWGVMHDITNWVLSFSPHPLTHSPTQYPVESSIELHNGFWLLLH